MQWFESSLPIQQCLVRETPIEMASIEVSSWLQMRNTGVQPVGSFYVENPQHTFRKKTTDAADHDNMLSIKIYENMRLPIYSETWQDEDQNEHFQLSWLAELHSLHAEQRMFMTDRFYHALIDDDKLARYGLVLAFPNIITQFTSEAWFSTLMLGRVWEIWKHCWQSTRQKTKPAALLSSKFDFVKDHSFVPKNAQKLHHDLSQHCLHQQDRFV